jgi:heterodisulfide reductase subunit C
MIISNILKGLDDTILCIDCQQCIATCPVRQAVGTQYMGPREIMNCARSGTLDRVEKGNLYYCTTCIRCTARCPRGLDVEAVNIKLRTELYNKNKHPEIMNLIIDNISKTKNVRGDKRPVAGIEKRARVILAQIKKLEKQLNIEG